MTAAPTGPDAAPGPPVLPVTFRPGRTRAVLLSVGTAVVAAFVAVALALPDPWTAVDRSAMIATGLVVFASLALLSRPRVVADDHGLTVVNPLTTRRLAWAEVLRVNLRVGDPWVRLDLADGTSLPALGIQPGIARARAVRDVRQLRELVELHGTGRRERG